MTYIGLISFQRNSISRSIQLNERNVHLNFAAILSNGAPPILLSYFVLHILLLVRTMIHRGQGKETYSSWEVAV
jgi:hypothetical protein